MTETAKLAAILIRSSVSIRGDIRDTLYMLKLRKKNACIVIESTPQNIGMLVKAKDYITYGTIDDATLVELTKKRKTKTPNLFFLHPPRGGFENRGIKFSYAQKGALGDRGIAINALIRRML